MILCCPDCGRRFDVPEAHRGRTIRCRTCRVPLGPEAAPADDVPAGPASVPGPAPRTNIAVLEDPSGLLLKGAYAAEFRPDGIGLSRGGRTAWIPVGVAASALERGKFRVVLGDRAVTLVIGRIDTYSDRLARHVVAYLLGRAGPPDPRDYAIPRGLMAAALLPLGIMGVAFQGGALGGAIGGAFAGSLLAINSAVARKERWPMASRVGACLGVSGAGYAVLVLVLVALFRGEAAGNAPGPGAAKPPEVVARPAVPAQDPAPDPAPAPAPAAEVTAWGTPEDPRADCRFDVRDNFATIEVPGTVHDLGAEEARDRAPRIMSPIAGDFVAEVRVIGEVRPTEPPAPGSHIAFQGAGLLLHGRADGLIRLERAAFVRGLDLRGYILFEHHQPGRPMDAQVGEYSGGPVALRLERRGTSVVGSYTVDGTTWRRLRPISFGEARPTVGVAAVNTAAAPFRAEFEGFKVTRP